MVEWSWNFEFSSYYVVLEEQSDAQWNRKMGPIPRQEGEHDRPAQDENSDIEDAGQLFFKYKLMRRTVLTFVKINH